MQQVYTIQYYTTPSLATTVKLQQQKDNNPWKEYSLLRLEFILEEQLRRGRRSNNNSTTMFSVPLRLTILALAAVAALAFTTTQQQQQQQQQRTPSFLMSSSVDDVASVPNFNAVEVAKTGGRGMATASQQAVERDLSLGAPRGRPEGGHFMTKGGIQVTANVEGLDYTRTGDEASLANSRSSEAAIESLVQKLDSQKGVLLTSSYEFPGRYARWSLGFVDPPLEVSGKADKCTIKALNDRGKVLLPAIERAMKGMKDEEILSSIDVTAEGEDMVQIDVTIVPPPPVGTFSEEERSRQVRACLFL